MEKKFDFDELIDRRNSGSLKWDVKENELPMWVADMDFRTAPGVVKAIEARAKTGIYGYAALPDRWYDAVISWWERRHGFRFGRDWLCFCTGVVPAVSSVVKRVTNVGDRVLVQTPVYDIFFHSIENAGRAVLESPLHREGGEYRIDFADLEKKLAEPLTTMMILCNPHNPLGRIWTREELGKIGALCAKYGVTVLSDEIHCDLTDPGREYVPFASVSEECRKVSVTCISASKAFNLAGMQSAAVVVPERTLRDKVVRGLNSDEVAEPNCFAAESTAAAFSEGEEWLDALRQYLYENKKFAAEFLGRELPEIGFVLPEATYLLWLDCGKIARDADELCDFLRAETGLYLNPGAQYRGEGKTFLRMNLACPRSRLKDGLERLARGIRAYGNRASASAKEIFERGGYTYVLEKEGRVCAGRERGIAPLLRLSESGADFRGGSAADKIVGRAAALLYAGLGIGSLYAEVLGEGGLAVLRRYKIAVGYGTLTKRIVNRDGTDICPMERAVEGIDEPEAAKRALHARLEELRGEKRAR